MYYPNIKLNNSHYDFLAVFLILTQAYIEFVYTNNFIFEIVNVIVLAGYIVVALAITLLINKYPNRILRSVILTALIILFFDIRADIFSLSALEATLIVAGCLLGAWILYLHASKILVAVFGVIFAFNVLLPVFPQVRAYPTANRPNAERTGDLPVYVHIILDEHTGVEVLDENIEKQRNLKQAIKGLYVENGFRLFGRAYSEYLASTDSLSAAFNQYSGDRPTELYVRNQSSRNYALSNNRYFRDLFFSGYNIQVYQSSWFDLCDSATDIIQSCLTYDLDGTSSAALARLETVEKLNVVLTVFWKKSRLQVWLHRAYDIAEIISNVIGAKLPHWKFAPTRTVGPIASLPVFDQLIADVAKAPSGTMFLAHLLIPHHAYSLNERCEIRRPLFFWDDAWTEGDQKNTEKSRLERYDDYIDQVQCSQNKIEDLIEAMRSAGTFENSIIIVQGDHGSRIFRTRPTIDNKDKLIPSDFYDGYSTFFAIKAPHISPGYDLQMLPLRKLLRYVSADLPPEIDFSNDHFVHLRGKSHSSIQLKVPMPAIPGGPDKSRSEID